VEESDYHVYRLHLGELARKSGCAVHAYCLMTNHVHLLVTPDSEGACTALMRDLGQRYVQYFNKHHGRTGTLWEGRFRSCLADAADYVLACYRYIELNPVRAGMVASPEGYRWSSYAANAGTGRDSLVSAHVEYLALGHDAWSRQSAYRLMLAGGVDDSMLTSIREATNGGYPLGPESFKQRLALLGRKVVPGRAGRRAKSELAS
jgi:putative transposase